MSKTYKINNSAKAWIAGLLSQPGNLDDDSRILDDVSSVLRLDAFATQNPNLWSFQTESTTEGMYVRLGEHIRGIGDVASLYIARPSLQNETGVSW